MFWITIVFFLSGLSALVYQLLWMRHLGFVFGNTIYASATVLTAFMGGLAIGSHLFGRISERMRNPIRGFAFLEIAVAAYALAMPWMFELIKVAYMLAFRHVSENMVFLTALRFVLASLILLVPTICMGGTLPVLIRGMARDDDGFGRKLGWLYGVNTLGAVAGVFLSGFYLIPTVGLTNTNILAVTSDFVAGMGALFLAKRHLVPEVGREAPRPKFRWSTFSPDARIALAFATLCGFVSLALEVIWFRALILVFGSTTYSFTVMLGVFLLGIGLGSLLVAPLLDRARQLTVWLAASVGLIGLYTLWSLYHFDNGPDYLVDHLSRHGFSWEAMNWARLVIAVSHLAVPALLFGAAFTIATRLVRHETSSSSGATGLVYALNTCGAVAGSFIAGFILLPGIGMERSLLLLSGILVIAGGMMVVWRSGAVFIKVLALALLITATATVVMYPPAWSKSLLAAGAYFSPFNFVRDGKNVLREMIAGDRLLHYHEALAATVSVHLSDNEEKYFCVDGKTEADQSARSMVLQRMIGHLPALFHPDAKSGVNIGLGAGVSFGSLACHPLDHVEVVEINPAVQYATRTWGTLNHHVLDNTNVTVTFNDGRNHLFSTPRMYDIVTADPFEPVMAGAAHLYTVEYFQLGYNRLNENGIMGQYLPLYEMSLDDYLTIVRSFVKVFPNTAVFFTGFDTILIGFKGEMRLDPEVLRRNFAVPEVQASLAEIGFTDPEKILGMFVADLSVDREFAGSGPLNTDEFPIIEFSTPKSSLRYTTDENQAALLRHFTPIPEAWLAAMEPDVADRLKREHEAVRLMLEASVMRANNEIESAFKKLGDALEIAPDNPVVRNEMVAMLVVSAQTLRKAGELQEAAQQFQMALQLDSDDFWSLYYLIELSMRFGHVEYGGKLLEHAMSLYPQSPLMLSHQAKYLFTQGDTDKAFELMRQAVKLQPNSRNLWSEVVTMAMAANDQILAEYAQGKIDALTAFIERR